MNLSYTDTLTRALFEDRLPLQSHLSTLESKRIKQEENGCFGDLQSVKATANIILGPSMRALVYTNILIRMMEGGGLPSELVVNAELSGGGGTEDVIEWWSMKVKDNDETLGNNNGQECKRSFHEATKTSTTDLRSLILKPPEQPPSASATQIPK
ncbi:hypothetical protein GQ457_18G023130 [Hibiscus cannabinus]